MTVAENRNSTNGKPRKTLANQIDRLDGILDGLADALNEAVATAVKDVVGVAVKEAVQSVMTEVLTNPTVLAKIQENVTKELQPQKMTEAKPSLWRKVASCCKGISNKCRQGWNWVCQSVGKLWSKTKQATVNALGHLWVFKQFKFQILLALAIGISAGVGAYFAGPWLATLASGVGSFAGTLGIQFVVWFRKMFKQTNCLFESQPTLVQ